jgi:plastocyanin
MNPRSILAAGAALLWGCAGPAPDPAQKAAAPAKTYFQVDAATAGKITGKVAFSGRNPKRAAIRMDAEEDCVKANKGQVLDESVLVNANNTVANVFVYVKTGLEGKEFAPATVPVQFDQKGCMFRPRIVGIQTGQTFVVTNSDPVTHNVHPLPRVNREWNQGQQPGSESVEREFTQPETMIPVKCNVHAWMRGYIGVLPHPYFAVSGGDGSFTIANLPPGDYTLEAWHEKLGAQQINVKVAPSGAATADFTLKGE